ncbi:MAG: hypothetical protein M1814_004882 [Vezdaea aestivalis]|nr:MAG: hypothetical protein M1814_004882 [Vezdaea aestivalis]
MTNPTFPIQFFGGRPGHERTFLGSEQKLEISPDGFDMSTSAPRSSQTSLAGTRTSYPPIDSGRAPSMVPYPLHSSTSGGSFHAEAISQAHPPSSFLVDPIKHEPYMATPQLSEDGFCTDFDAHIPYQRYEHTLDRAMAALQSPPASFASPSPSVTMQTTTLETTSTPVDLFNDQLGALRAGTDEEDMHNDEPYARLIYRALMSAPGNQMVLKDIYAWFIRNTDKPNQKNGSDKGWQNSIRHNLSMNGAFHKVEQPAAEDNSKRGYVWVLAEEAKIDGVKSTTRYRKTGSNSKKARSEYPAPARQRSGRRGGKAAKKGKHKACVRLQPPASESATGSSTIKYYDNVTSAAVPASHTNPHYMTGVNDSCNMAPYLSIMGLNGDQSLFSEAVQPFVLTSDGLAELSTPFPNTDSVQQSQYYQDQHGLPRTYSYTSYDEGLLDSSNL